MSSLWIFIISIIITLTTCEDVEVEINDGTILGNVQKTPYNISFYAFRQIPYASPPIGDLRFQPPQPVQKWKGVLNATLNTKVCYQVDDPNIAADEDCLYLNVYTPVKPPSKKSLPVLLFIHGGKFYKGNSTMETYGPDFFMGYDVVVVTVQYRLGAFGFLSTQDSVIPGNNGLRDTLAALKWLKDNIGVFGGNHELVTLVGQSAGAALVGYHVISEKSAGLFRAAIMQSGSALASWAYQRYSKKYAYQLANAIDKNFSSKNSSQELLKLLKTASAEDITNAVFEGPDGIQLGQGDLFTPVIEVEHEDAFITDLMYPRLQKGEYNQVPVLMGVNSEEMIRNAANLNAFVKTMGKYDENITLIVNEDYNVSQENLTIFGNRIREIYTNGSFHENPGKAMQFRSDTRYTTAVSAQAALQSKFSDVFFYVFGFAGFLTSNITIDGADKVGHGDQMVYLWKSRDNADLSKYPEKDLLTLERMVTLWTNFVKYLDPTAKSTDILQNIKWPKVTPNNFSYLNIEGDLEIRQNPKKYKEWKALIDEYGNPPFDTY